MPDPQSPSGPRSHAGARPGGDPADLTAIWAVITGMYEAYTSGDRERTDSFLDTEATIWDSATPELLRGHAELDRVRESRPTVDGGPRESALHASGQVIDVFGGVAVARYWLRVDFHPPTSGAPFPSQLVRNTAVFRRSPDGWLIIHLHEDVQPPKDS